jgi:hypothetical protein
MPCAISVGQQPLIAVTGVTGLAGGKVASLKAERHVPQLAPPRQVA